jgi:hypothetical protein
MLDVIWCWKGRGSKGEGNTQPKEVVRSGRGACGGEGKLEEGINQSLNQSITCSGSSRVVTGGAQEEQAGGRGGHIVGTLQYDVSLSKPTGWR